MCLHCVYKVSGCFSKSCGTSWIPRICTTYATLRITKGNNSKRIGPWPLIFYYKCTNVHLIDINVSAKFDEFPSLPFQDIKEKQKRHGRTDGKTDGRTTWKQDPPPTNIVCGGYKNRRKVNRKVQKEPQAEAAANPRHQEEEKKWHRLTCA